MNERLKVLERIADLALQVRTLERELLNSADPRLVMERLKQARLDLDAELAELGLLDKER
jgi:hypothetical protein